jgi:hypothetical protein
MLSEVAKRLGVEQQFTEGRTQEQWVRICMQNAGEPALPMTT